METKDTRVVIDGQELLVRAHANEALGCRINVWRRAEFAGDEDAADNIEGLRYARIGSDPDRNLFEQLPERSMGRSEVLVIAYRARRRLAERAIRTAFTLPAETMQGDEAARTIGLPYFMRGEWNSREPVIPPVRTADELAYARTYDYTLGELAPAWTFTDRLKEK